MAAQTPSVRVVYERALTIASAADRQAYLDNVCACNPELRGQLEALLKTGAVTVHLCEPPSSGSATTTDHRLITEQPGSVIGPYKLLEQIGEGGFGVVFMAEQERPVRRRVALKVIKPGMDTRQVIARFEAERQALALMDHSNIAHVLDGGATDSGRPYFVMELVRGIPLTDFCDQSRLAVDGRLKLFITVCHAVQHAHQKGIIHRDLKPSNVLVTLHDGQPVAKVIDFGVAKATGQRLTEKTLFTAFAQMVGTPLYMSPEQAEMSGLDVDTRSDIYSLGVMLYEVLSGTTPFDRKRLQQASYEEIRRIIREEEPQKPSTRLSTLGATVTTISRCRQSDPDKLRRLLRGELDWIVMKCLDKDRNRRYETANGLARDIERYLHDEPVLACPPSTIYRFGKFARRNQVAFVTTAIVVAALVAGTLISTWQAVRATRAERLARARTEAEQSARRDADTQAVKANSIAHLLQELLASANPDGAGDSDYTVRELLDEFSAQLGEQLRDQPEAEADIRAIMGKVYARLGLEEQADRHLTAAIGLQRRVYGDRHEKLADSLADYAWSLHRQKRYAESQKLALEALAICRDRRDCIHIQLRALRTLQQSLFIQLKHSESEAIAQRAFAIARAAGGEGIEYPEVASIMHSLADSKTTRGEYAEGESLAREAVELHRRLNGPAHVETGWGLLVLGRVLREQEKDDEALECFRGAWEIFQTQFGDLDYFGKRLVRANTDPWVVRARQHVMARRWPEALAEYDKIIDLRSLSEEWIEYACLRLLAGDANGYSAFCARTIDRTGLPQDAASSLVLARINTLRNNPSVEPAPIIHWAEQALASKPDSPRHLHVTGAAYYRGRHYELALRRLQKSDGLDSPEWSAVGKAQNALLLAMTQHQLGFREEARRRLRAATEQIHVLTGADSNVPPNISAADWLSLHVFRHEAEDLLDAQQTGIIPSDEPGLERELTSEQPGSQ